MPSPRLTDAEFVTAWANAGCSPAVMAAQTGTSVRVIYSRRQRMAERGTVLGTAQSGRGGTVLYVRDHTSIRQRREIGLDNGTVVVFSDAHYWPGESTVAHKALVRTIKTLKPAVVIANGDVLDGASISRHDPNGWEQRPTLKQELEACKERMGEIEDAAGLDCELLWNFGNHDQRFDRTLAINAPQFEGLLGTTLQDHFSRWTFQMSTMINDGTSSPIMVKHRYANGLHAAYNNTLKAGISMVTGHLHRLTVTTWGDYRGRRYGVDTGTLADPVGPQFTYGEDAPSPHGSGFAVLTIHEGDLLPPELAEVRGASCFFRGAAV